jgi:hypothetical protein
MLQAATMIRCVPRRDREATDMENVDTLILESDWLPSAELDRLVSECRRDLQGLSVSTTVDSAHRGLDPTVAVELISGLVSIIIPFVTKLAERVFANEPEAVLTVSDAAGKDQAVLKAILPPEVRDQLLEDALASGALRVRISLERAST